MSGRVWAICRTLLRANRVLLALLMAWPCALGALVVLVSHGHPDPDDMRAILQQELLYGLVLVALGSSVALGNELRGHRVWAVLGRAVSRTEYLLALYASALVPFFGYLAVLLGSALFFRTVYGVALPHCGILFAAEALTGMGIGAAGILASVFLPQVLASIASGVLLAGLFAAGRAGLGLFAVIAGQARVGGVWLAAWSTLAGTVVLFFCAAARFARRDLET